MENLMTVVDRLDELQASSVKVKVKVSVFIQRAFSRRSGMDHTVLPAITSMPASTS